MIPLKDHPSHRGVVDVICHTYLLASSTHALHDPSMRGSLPTNTAPYPPTGGLRGKLHPSLVYLHFTTYYSPFCTFVVAMYQLLSRSRMLYVRASNVQLVRYLHGTSITPSASHRGGRPATYYLLFASHASDTLPSPHPSHRGGGGV